MRRAPIQDPLYGAVTVRADSRAMHDMHRFQVKAPADSHGPYDHCMLLATIPAASAFQPLTQGGCPMVKP